MMKYLKLFEDHLSTNERMVEEILRSNPRNEERARYSMKSENPLLFIEVVASNWEKKVIRIKPTEGMYQFNLVDPDILDEDSQYVFYVVNEFDEIKDIANRYGYDVRGFGAVRIPTEEWKDKDTQENYNRLDSSMLIMIEFLPNENLQHKYRGHIATKKFNF